MNGSVQSVSFRSGCQPQGPVRTHLKNSLNASGYINAHGELADTVNNVRRVLLPHCYCTVPSWTRQPHGRSLHRLKGRAPRSLAQPLARWHPSPPDPPEDL